MALLATQQIGRTAAAITRTAAAGGGDTFAADDKTFLDLVNGHSSSQTVTIVTDGTVDGLAIADIAVAIPAGESRIIGMFPQIPFGTSAGLVSLTYSGVTLLTVAVLRAA